MRRLLLLVIAVTLVGTDPTVPGPDPTVSEPDLATATPPRGVATRFALAMYKFSNSLYKAAAVKTDDHFVISTLNVWLSLAAMAEGAAGDLRRELLQATDLPPANCKRKKYYTFARKVANGDDEVKMRRKRVLVVDEAVTLNDSWASEVRSLGLLEAVSLPLRAAPQRALALAGLPPLPTDLPALEEDSLLVDSLDFEAVLTTAFADAYLERDAPFYDDAGRLLGSVDLVRFEKRVKLAHVPLLNVKAIEIPVGLGGTYRLLMAMNVDRTPLRASIEKMPSTIITDIFANMRESTIPLQVGIPVFNATSVFPDMRALLERAGGGAGVHRLWRDPAGSARISSPPAPPAAYLQRVSLQLSAAPAPAPARPPAGLQAASELATGLAAALGRDFIANRPFMYALVDSAEYVNCFTGAFSRPTKPLRP